MIEETKLQEWERLANEATDGPWCLVKSESFPDGNVLSLRPKSTKDDKATALGACRIAFKNDYEFMAAAREAVPELIAEVRKLNKEVDWLAEKLSRMIDDCPKEKAKSYCYEAPFCVACWRGAARKAVQNV